MKKISPILLLAVFVVSNAIGQQKNMSDSSAVNQLDSICSHVEKMPEFIGGQPALFRYISEHLEYPKVFYHQKSKVVVSFVIDEAGAVTSAEIVRSVDEVADQAVLKLVKAMPAWKPGMHHGEKVKVRYLLPVQVCFR